MRESISSTSLKSIYDQYMCIDDQAFYDKIRYFEKYEEEVLQMNLKASIYIHYEYLKALYLVEDFGKYIYQSQHMLERIIEENIGIFQGEDLFQEVLQRRAASYYYLSRYKEATYHAKELLAIDFQRKDTKRVLYFSVRNSFVRFRKFLKAALLVVSFTGAITLLFEQIVVASFYPDQAIWIIQYTILVFIALYVLLIIGKLYTDISAWFEVNQCLQKCRLKQSKKEKLSL